ncbi:COG1470 family protein [Halomicrobium urmianum]|uniref:COG1470 family protein n=1 Tax=Halomicrobium urmianum TaxID=1586233 RepID=UPI001CD9E8CA|nr:hypothetical protein [Halomicrobium urmianum]
MGGTDEANEPTETDGGGHGGVAVDAPPDGRREIPDGRTPGTRTLRSRGRRRFLRGALALGLPAALGGTAAAQSSDVDVAFRDAVTAEITGDVASIEGLHCYVWSHVDVVDDHLLLEDLDPSWSNEVLDGGLRVIRYDPDEGDLVVALNTVAYNYLATIDVYTSGDPDFFGDHADLTARNDHEVVAAMADTTLPDGPFGRDDTASADVTVANLRDDDREVFVGFSAIDPEGGVRTNDRTTGQSVALDGDGSQTVTVSWDVESDAPTGDYDAHLAVWEEADRDALETKCDELYAEAAFEVREDGDVGATLVDASVPGGTYGSGEAVTATATVENEAAAERTYFVGYSAIDPDGLAHTNDRTTGRAVTFGPGERRDVTVSWAVESDAPDGSYDAQIAVWAESDRDALETKLDERILRDAFAVGEAPKIDARIEDVAVSGGTYGDGDVVETDVTVTNTGSDDHTFFVGYSAIDPEGLAHTNGGTTGGPATLSAGETSTVTVEWTVESGAPAGSYDVHVAVWAESDPDELETNLAERVVEDAVEVA